MSHKTDRPESPDTLRVAAARLAILDRIQPIQGVEKIAVRAALGRVLAEDVVAPFNVPGHDNSAMDGYCLRAADLPASEATACLQVIGKAFAGGAFPGEIGSNQAVRIMTGAPIPTGGDTVVMQEDVQLDGENVIVGGGHRPGQNVRRAGEDLAAGQAALRAGRRITPVDLGLIASLGVAEVAVVRRLRVAFFSTGDELASIGQTLASGQIYDSNRYTLFGVLARLGVELLDMGVIRDHPDTLEAAMNQAANMADVVITTGGVSVGEADFIKELVNRLGRVEFWKLAIKPGRPMAFGHIGQATFFGLPGNPVAVLVSFYQIVLDALYKRMGIAPLPLRPTVLARAAAPIRKLPGRREFPRGVLFRDEAASAEWQVRLTGNQGSGILNSVAEANCFIDLPEDQGNIAAGDWLVTQPFDGLV